MKILTPKGWKSVLSEETVVVSEAIISDYSKKKAVDHITHDEDGEAGKTMPNSDFRHMKDHKPTATVKSPDGQKHEVWHHPKGHTIINSHGHGTTHDYAMRLKGHHDPQKVVNALHKGE
jgi:hypothetical protein